MFTIPALISDKLLSLVIDYLKKGGEKLVKDADTKREIKKAIERAAERFAHEYTNQELAKALAVDTKFYDLVSVQKAIREVLEHPFDPAPQIRIENEFAMVLPKTQSGLASDAAQAYLEILREELIGIEKLTDKLKLIYLKRTTDAAERTANGVEQLVSMQEKSPDLEDAKQKYLKYIIDTNQYVDPRGIMQTRRSVALKLDDVYITLKVQRELTSIRADKIYQQGSDEQSSGTASKNTSDDESVTNEQLKGETIELAKALRDNMFLVFLGDPGAGKTTLTRFLSLQFAKACLSTNVNEVIDRDGNNYGEIRLPIFVRISQYATLYLSNPNISIRDFVLGNYGEVDVDGDVLRTIFEKYINLGQTIIMLDGLDEIVDSNDRSEISRRIERFVSSCNAKNQFIITSRIAGYRSAALTSNFSHFVLCELERNQIERFLKSWCPAVELSLLPDASESQRNQNADSEIDDILNSVDENAGVRRLASNPLMLTILALIHRNGARLPSRRVELYQLAVKTLLEDWELARGLSAANIVRESEALRMLGPLAYWIHENKPNGLASEREIKDKLVFELATTRGLPIEHPEVQDAVDDFIRRVREHTGLFVEKAPQQYGFMHLTFEEYFAARDLVKRRGQAIQNIYKHRHDSRWEEVLLLAIAYESNDHPSDAQDYIQTAILARGEEAKRLAFEPSQHEAILHRDLLLAIRMIGDCIGLESVFIQSVIEDLKSLWEKRDSRRSTIKNMVSDTLTALKGSETLSGIVPELLLLAKDKNKYLRQNAVWGLGFLGYLSDDVKETLLNAFEDDVIEVRNLAIESLGKLECTNDEIVDSLIEKLNDDEPSWIVGYALGRLCNSSNTVLNKVFNALKDMGDSACSKVLPAIGLYGKDNKLIFEGIKAALQEDNLFMRQYAARASIYFVDADFPVIEVLLQRVNDKDPKVRAEIASTLGRFITKDARIANMLLELVKEDVSIVKISAINSLANLSDYKEEVIENLLVALNDNRSGVRRAAAQALGRLKNNDDKIISKLLVSMKDGDENVVWNSVGSLCSLGVLNDVVINKIMSGLGSLDIDEREKAIDSLDYASEIPEIFADALLNLFSNNSGLDDNTLVTAGNLFLKAKKDADKSYLYKELKNRNHFYAIFVLLSLMIEEEGEASNINPQLFLDELSSTDRDVCILASMGLSALPENARYKLDKSVYPTLRKILVEELVNYKGKNKICRMFEISKDEYLDGLVQSLSNIYS